MLDAVIAFPAAVGGAHPLRRQFGPSWLPVVAIVLCLADIHVGEHEPPRAVALALQARNLALRQPPRTGAVSGIDDEHVEIVLRQRCGGDVLKLVAPRLRSLQQRARGAVRMRDRGRGHDQHRHQYEHAEHER